MSDLIGQTLPVDGRAWCLVGTELPSVDDASRWAVSEACGALVTFTGLVRSHSVDATGVVAIEYDAYRVAAVERLEQIARAALDSWDELERIALWHCTGLVKLSEPCVLVAASAAHRGAAFQAAHFCIDVVKQVLTVWKNEHAATNRGWVTTGVQPVTVDRAVASWLAVNRGAGHVA